MELNEEKELAKAVKGFESAIQIFTKRDYKKAEESFAGIIETFADSEYYSVLEVQARAKVYKNICQAQLNPVKVELTTDEDYLTAGVYNMNNGDFDNALEALEHVADDDCKDAYVCYLKSIIYLKKEEVETALEFLEKAVEKDKTYKVIAHNEVDFDEMFDNEEFVAIISDGL
ncbi:MAG: tetratricopeptide repeat protein [bacterium]|nr:tetratricopeptide repeat protein [bacterium]